jgi:Holliday junction resolvasome RuvABC ATP-dependent DNA helicase subunit
MNAGCEITRLYSDNIKKNIDKSTRKTYRIYNRVIRKIKRNAKHGNGLVEIDEDGINIFLLKNMLENDGFSTITNAVNKVLVIL